MRIAIVSDAIYPYNKGGKEIRIYEISRRLVKRGHEVHIFTMKWWEGEDVILKEGVYLHGVCKLIPLYTKGRRSIFEALYFAFFVFFALLKEDFDLIDADEFPYFPCISTKLVCLIKRKPLIITWLEVWDKYWFEYLGIWGVFGFLIERFAIKLPNYIISISEKSRKNLISLSTKEKEVEAIPIGIDFEEIQKVQSNKENFDCIFAGRLIKEKNVDILIKSIDLVKKEIPNVKCLIIGDGPEKEKLEKMTKDIRLENNIKFLRFLEDHNDVISYMKSSKIFVFPTTREGFGVVVLEANACGLPVIAIDHERNAAADLIEDGKNGFLVDLSENLISEKIIKLLKDDKLREEMTKYSFESIKKYNWDNIINRVEETYKMVIK